MRRTWTADEMAELERLTATGLRMREIAARLGRSYDSVACKVANMGLEVAAGQGRPRKHDYRGIGAMRDAGMSIKAVGRRLGRGAEYAARMVAQ